MSLKQHASAPLNHVQSTSPFASGIRCVPNRRRFRHSWAGRWCPGPRWVGVVRTQTLPRTIIAASKACATGARRSGNCRPPGARRAGQDRAAPKGSLDAPKRSRTIEHRSDATGGGAHELDRVANTARVNSIGLAPSSGRIGVCERNRISSSADSGSARRASIDWAMNAKSFKVPSKLRFLVRPNANSDIRIRSSAMSAAATPTMASLSHTASGNTVLKRLDSLIGTIDRKSRPFADEEEVLTSADSKDVAVPVAEPRGGLDGRQVADLFQPDEQLLCAPENDHQFVSLQSRHRRELHRERTVGAIMTWIGARTGRRSWTQSGPRLSGRSGR